MKSIVDNYYRSSGNKWRFLRTKIFEKEIGLDEKLKQKEEESDSDCL